MGSFEQSDHGGPFAIVIGIIGLVFGGIVLSLLIESRMDDSAAAVSLEGDIAKQEVRLEELGFQWESSNRQWQECRGAFDHQDELTELRVAAENRERRRGDLEEKASAMLDEIEELTASFANYRVAYHESARKRLVGKEFPSFTLTDGTTYHEVRVTGHDDKGLQIRHATGGAKLRYSEMPREWRERLQWSPLLKVEKRNFGDAGMPGPPESLSKGIDPTSPDRGPAEEEQKEISRRVQDARTRLLRARAEYVDASYAASMARSKASGSERSVPGSLETWSEHAVRMERAANSARRRQLEAWADLAELAPGDPLLGHGRP